MINAWLLALETIKCCCDDSVRPSRKCARHFQAVEELEPRQLLTATASDTTDQDVAQSALATQAAIAASQAQSGLLTPATPGLNASGFNTANDAETPNTHFTQAIPIGIVIGNTVVAPAETDPAKYQAKPDFVVTPFVAGGGDNDLLNLPPANGPLEGNANGQDQKGNGPNGTPQRVAPPADPARKANDSSLNLPNNDFDRRDDSVVDAAMNDLIFTQLGQDGWHDEIAPAAHRPVPAFITNSRPAFSAPTRADNGPASAEVNQAALVFGASLLATALRSSNDACIQPQRTARSQKTKHTSAGPQSV